MLTNKTSKHACSLTYDLIGYTLKLQKVQPCVSPQVSSYNA